jgi:hypothetical protein
MELEILPAKKRVSKNTAVKVVDKIENIGGVEVENKTIKKTTTSKKDIPNKNIKKKGKIVTVQTTSETETNSKPVIFNHIHKRFMVLYNLSDMRRVWAKVRSDFKKQFKLELPKRFGKYPELWLQLNLWIEGRISNVVLEGGTDITYYNKADLVERGWDNKIIMKLYPNPDKVIYLGRGRHAYYYNGERLYELEDGDEFLEYISAKLERQRKRESSRVAKLSGKLGVGFGGEFVR